MGDAMVGAVLQSFKSTSRHSIRNASDPQIPNPDHDIEGASRRSALIYAKYGDLTTAASLIATWAIIETSPAALGEPEHVEISPRFTLGRLPPERKK